MHAVFLVSIVSWAELRSHTLCHHLNHCLNHRLSHCLNHDYTVRIEKQWGSLLVRGLNCKFAWFYSWFVNKWCGGAYSLRSALEVQLDQLCQGHHPCHLCHLFLEVLGDFGRCCSYWLHSARHSYWHTIAARGQLALQGSSWNGVSLLYMLCICFYTCTLACGMPTLHALIH